MSEVYRKQNGSWVKKTAYQRINGEWVLISRAPVAYLYNGVRLPKLPEWDREMYPYAWIRQYKNTTYFGVCSYRPYYSSKSEDVVCIGFALDYKMVDDCWTLYRDGLLSVGFGSSSTYVWSNFDLIAEDGTVYKTAGTSTDPDAPPKPSDPVYPTPDKNRNYLYGNVEMPALFDYNPLVYPYVCVFSDVCVLVTRSPLIWEYDNNHTPCIYAENRDGKWYTSGLHEFAGSFDSDKGEVNFTNYDMKKWDGSVYREASNPIPIYE